MSVAIFLAVLVVTFAAPQFAYTPTAYTTGGAVFRSAGVPYTGYTGATYAGYPYAYSGAYTGAAVPFATYY